MADDMKIVVIGQAAFGKDVLAALTEGGENVVGVFCPPDLKGRPVDPIKHEAAQRGIPVFPVPADETQGGNRRFP